MRIIDIRIEVEDDRYGEAMNVAHNAAHDIREDLYDPEYLDDENADHGFSVEVFDVTELTYYGDPLPHPVRRSYDDGSWICPIHGVRTDPTDECPAGGAHVWTNESSHPDRVYDRHYHCDECGASAPPEEKDYP